MPRKVALILAGGNAKRFQTKDQKWEDKALAQIDGKPLIVNLIQNIINTVDEVAVCVNDEQRKKKYLKILDNHAIKSVEFVVDEKNLQIKGPSRAILSGLHAVSADHYLVVPTDMPFLKPEVSEYLFSIAKGVDVVVPVWPDGRLETLLMVVERKNVTTIAELLCLLNKPRVDTIIRGATRIFFVSPLKEIINLDEKLESFININTKDNLNKLESRSTIGAFTENQFIDRGKLPVEDLKLFSEGIKQLNIDNLKDASDIFKTCRDKFVTKNIHFWAALSNEKLGETALKFLNQQKKANETYFEVNQAYLRAADNYNDEAKIYINKGCKFLGQRALADKTMCEAKFAIK